MSCDLGSPRPFAGHDDLLAVSSHGSEQPLPKLPPLVKVTMEVENGVKEMDNQSSSNEDDRYGSDYQSQISTDILEEPDLPPLDYSRKNGLTLDYLAEKYIEVEGLQASASIETVDHSHLPQFSLGDPFKVEERLSLSRDGAALLASITREETVATIDSLIYPMLESTRSLGRTKLELPLLRSDHITDCKTFAQRESLEIGLSDIKLPLEALNEESGEGLSWPEHFWNIGPKLLEDLKAEKIAVPKDTVAYLSKSLKVEWSEKDSQTLWESEVRYKKNLALEPVTPPLSPLRCKWEPLEASSSDSVFNVPLTSDPISPTKKELDAIEKEIFMQDIPTPLRNRGLEKPSPSVSSSTYVDDNITKLGDIYSPLAAMDSNLTPPSMLETERVRREDLKVEEPITPDGPLISLPKAVRFHETMQEVTMDSPQSRLNSPEFENKFFEEAFGVTSKAVNRRLEQEKLIEADATARVDVPILDFSKPDPPWVRFEQHKSSKSLTAMQIYFIQDTIGASSVWPGRRKCDLKLRWIPWDKDQPNIALDEQIEQNASMLDRILGSPLDQTVIDSSCLAWKRAGLTILHDGEEDDEVLEQGCFIQEALLDMTSLIKKRKLELQEKTAMENQYHPAKRPMIDINTVPRAQNPVSHMPVTDSTTIPRNQIIKYRDVKNMVNYLSKTNFPMNNTHEKASNMLLDGAFSAEKSLNNYLEIRGIKKAKLSESSYFESNATKALEKVFTKQEVVVPPFGHQTTQAAGLASLPIPTIPAKVNKLTAIVASALMKQRSLVKHISNILPSLELVERDFSAHNTTTWMAGSVTRSPIISPLAAEADLIISASTGIVVATLQKIKQKLLPGQKGKTAIRSRVEQVSLRYEKLVVLVSEGRHDESTNGMDESDCLALNDFMGFALGLSASVSVHFVAGGEETLAKWIANSVIQCQSADKTELLIDETLWELFLRRAGLNTFAAQAIIASLKAPEGIDTLSPSKAGQFGLTAFVEMGHQNRLARFSRVCGQRLLERVSPVLDEGWES